MKPTEKYVPAVLIILPVQGDSISSLRMKS